MSSSSSSSAPATAGHDSHDVEANASLRTLFRLSPYLRPYRWSLFWMAVAAFGAVLMTIVIPLVTKHLIDGPIRHHQTAGVLPLGLLALSLGCLEAFLIWLRRWVQSNAVLGLETTMRKDLYRRLQELPMSFHSQWGSGQLLSRAIQDLSQIRRFSGFGMLFLVMNILQLLITTLVLLQMYWPLGLVVAAAAVPIIMLSMRFERRYTRISRRVQDEQGDLATLAEEGAVGIRTIKSFGRSRHVSEQYAAQARQLHDTNLEKVRTSARFWTFLEMIPNVAVVVVLALGAVGVGRGAITTGELVAFITLMLSLVWPVSSLGMILAMSQEAMTAAARILEIFDTEPSIVSGTRTIDHPRGHVRFEGVHFGFAENAQSGFAENAQSGFAENAQSGFAENAQSGFAENAQSGFDDVRQSPRGDHPEEILSGLDLEIRPGETVALVGATGSGKTLLTALIPRLYDVTGGRVTIDGVDVRELDLVHLRTLVATAFEEPTLFSMSARENLVLGRLDATDEEIAQAIDIAQAHFIHDLPWGLETRIGEQGMSLSGGQRQRLALARAVLARPKVLILDDTLSALDVHTEKLVEQELRRVLADTTALIVAHRASTVLLADRVALLQDGRITATGGHRELLATVPAYRELLSAYDSDDGSRPELDDLDDDYLEGAESR
ncbi:ABC transporter ATP-binding protein [Nocardioides sp. KR10-350]|uniref:ABC transporter ATP-binding protein n=1 Tax=Nocardioides cheoyonin TaxID=3156615 RepID=UPI0032B43D19